MIEFISITTDPELARRLWRLPGNTVMVDLEHVGKAARQASRDTVLNAHTLADVQRLASIPGRGSLMVRTNAAEHGGAAEAAALAELAVDRVMLPMFRTWEDVGELVAVLRPFRGPAPRLSLLAETDDAVRGIDAILLAQPRWVDHVHIGLNDLSLERGTPFLFEPVATGEIAELAGKVRGMGRRFGFGGVGYPGEGMVPPEWILGEHVRVGSGAVILSRSFYGALDPGAPDALEGGVELLRAHEARWRTSSATELEANHRRLRRAITGVSARMRATRTLPAG